MADQARIGSEHFVTEGFSGEIHAVGAASSSIVVRLLKMLSGLLKDHGQPP